MARHGRPRGAAVVAVVLSLLLLAPSASAGAPLPALSARRRHPAGGPHALMRQEAEEATLGGGAPNKLELCGTEVVADTCRVLRRADTATKPEMSVTVRQLDEALGMCPDMTDVNWLIKTLKLEESLVKHPTSSERADMSIGCDDLCEASLAYFKGMGPASGSKNAFVVPPYADTTCWRNRDGALTCDLAVAPDAVLTDIKANNFYGSTQDNQVAKSDQGSMDKGVAFAPTGVVYTNCPFQSGLSVVRVAQLFRYYPRRIDNDEAVMVGATEGIRKRVYQGLAKAEAWLSLSLRAMINDRTVAADKEYFGAKGPLSKEEVSDAIWRVMAYALRVFMGGMRATFPGPTCEDWVNAYVRSSASIRDGQIRPNMFGCDRVPNQCGVSPDGRHNVYLCKQIFQKIDPEFVSVLVHEAVHYAGPTDVTYDEETYLHKINQTQQLNNAKNYQMYLLAVVTHENDRSKKGRTLWMKMADNFKKRKARRKRKRQSRKATKARRKQPERKSASL